MFVMFPAVRDDKDTVEPLPPIGPVSIHRVTSVPPDLTRLHPREVRQVYQKRKAYYSTVTLQEHLRRYPSEPRVTEEQFETARSRIVAERLEDFMTDPILQEHICFRHATAQQSKKVGYLSMPEQAVLKWRFQQQGMTPDQAWQKIAELKFVALYDTPEKTKLYLYDLIQEPIGDTAGTVSPAVTAHAPAFEWQSEAYQVIYLPQPDTSVLKMTVPRELARVFRVLDCSSHKSMRRLSIWEALGKPGAKETFRPDKYYKKWARTKELKKPLLSWKNGVFTLHPPRQEPPGRRARK